MSTIEAKAGDAPDVDARVIDLVVRIGFLGLFAYWSFRLVAPFVLVVVWAVVLAVAVYPIHTWISERLGGRSKPTSFLFTLLGLAIVLGPTAVLATSMISSLTALSAELEQGTLSVPLPGDAIKNWPFIGQWVHETWTLASTNVTGFLSQYLDVIQQVAGSLLGSVVGLGGDVLMFAVSVVIAGFLYGSGPKLASGARILATRIVGERGGGFLDLAGATIRNVARGVIGISLLQAVLAGIGLMLADVPAAGLLTFGVLLLGIIQIGPSILIIPVIIWAWTDMGTFQALIFTAYMLPVALLDNVLKPIVMAKGLQTPMLIVFIGVIGGTLAHGLIGLFLGPIVLAVFYELLIAWAARSQDADASIEEGNVVR